MTACLRCIVANVDDIVDTYYARLNLEPWEVYACKRREENVRAGRSEAEFDRRTGRTLHGLLESIAHCEKHGLSELGIMSKVMLLCANDLTKKLGVAVVARPVAVSTTFAYVDHHHG